MADIDVVIENQRELSKSVFEFVPLPHGPKAIFYHHGLLLERLEDVRTIVERIGQARARSTVLAERADRLRPAKEMAGKPYSKKLSAVMHESSALTRQMKLDTESLYVFGNLCLTSGRL
jgi:hypothetical protein